MKNTFLFVAIILFVCTSAFAYDWSVNLGDGSSENPFQISTPDHLMSIGSDVNLLDKSYILICDIVFDPNNNPEHVFTAGLIAPYISSQGIPGFSGHFDGKGFKVVNLKINNGERSVGLFGSIMGTSYEDVLVENVTLVNPLVSGASASGSLVGLAENCKIRNCHVTGGLVSEPDGIGNGGLLGGISYSIAEECTSSADVIGDYCLGGLAGSTNYSCLVRCSASGSVTGRMAVGGLLGHAFPWFDLDMVDRVEIVNCFATGDVHAEHVYGGGLIGRVLTGSVRNCYASGSVTGGSILGGLIGTVEFLRPPGGNSGSFTEIVISECYSTGDVDGQVEFIGGFIGKNLEIVKDCYASGSVKGNSSVGGLIGIDQGTITFCFSTGQVEGIENTGGLIGSNGSSSYGMNHLCFWDVEASGIGASGDDNFGAIGKTTAEMKSWSTFTDADWDFNEVWIIGMGHYPMLSPRIAGDINSDGIVNLKRSIFACQ